MKIKPSKPLGHKAYGSIPHLSSSRLGPGDHYCDPGQESIATKKARDGFDLVIVQEKLDGSNCAVAKIDGEIVPLVRAGYRAETSPYEQHHLFAKWVAQEKERFDAALQEGERLVGEWLIQAHGTRYNLPHEPFVVFDLMRGQVRALYLELMRRVHPHGFRTPFLVHIGGPVSVSYILKQLGILGSGHGATDPVEGAVWRVEREGKVDFLAKWVYEWKEDGKYLPEISGGEAIWNADDVRESLLCN